MIISERNESVVLLRGSEHLSLMHISDIHLWFSTRILEKLTSLIVQNRPRLLILTGDYFDIPPGADNFYKFLKDISELATVIFIFGNHDKFYGRKKLCIFEGIPNCICVDEKVFSFTTERGNVFNFTSWKNRENLPKATSEVNVILIHNPEKLRQYELGDIDIVLAGHLHGGQFRFFRTKDGSHFPGNIFYRYGIDRKQIGTTTLIVSRGLGDTFPFRWNCPKEVVNILIQ